MIWLRSPGQARARQHCMTVACNAPLEEHEPQRTFAAAWSAVGICDLGVERGRIDPCFRGSAQSGFSRARRVRPRFAIEIEIGAFAVVVWELKGTGQGREKRALRLIGSVFFALAVYVFLSSSRSLWLHARPATSPLGMVWLALTCAVMLLLAAGKARTGAQLNNPVLQSEACVTVVDALLAASVLLSIALSALFGWWWADPLAGFVLVFYGIKEGRHA